MMNFVLPYSPRSFDSSTKQSKVLVNDTPDRRRLHLFFNNLFKIIRERERESHFIIHAFPSSFINTLANPTDARLSSSSTSSSYSTLMNKSITTNTKAPVLYSWQFSFVSSSPNFVNSHRSLKSTHFKIAFFFFSSMANFPFDLLLFITYFLAGLLMRIGGES